MLPLEWSVWSGPPESAGGAGVVLACLGERADRHRCVVERASHDHGLKALVESMSVRFVVLH